MSALVVGSRSRISNAIVRGLGQAGLEVFTADTSSITRSSFSKYTSRHFTYRSPKVSKDNFFSDIKKIIKISGAEVLFSGDEWIYYFLVENKSLLGDSIKFLAPTHNQIESIRTKDVLVSIADELNIMTPKSVIVRSADDLSGKVHELHFPVIVKPIAESAGRGVSFAKDLSELRKTVGWRQDSLGGRGFVVQEFVAGDTYGVATVFVSGNPLLEVCYEQIHQHPASGGVPTITQLSQEKSPAKILFKILSNIEWHGVCQADFIKERTTGRFFLIDINPRFFGAVYTSIASGINIPLAMYEAALKEKTSYVISNVRDLKVIWVEGEIRRLFSIILNPINYFKTTHSYDYKSVNRVEDYAFADYKPLLCFPLWYIAQKLCAEL